MRGSNARMRLPFRIESPAALHPRYGRVRHSSFVIRHSYFPPAFRLPPFFSGVPAAERIKSRLPSRPPMNCAINVCGISVSKSPIPAPFAMNHFNKTISWFGDLTENET